MASLPDTITITEYHYLDVKSSGADISCVVDAGAREGPYPQVITRIKSALRELKINEGAISIEQLKRDNEQFGCFVGILFLILVAVGITEDTFQWHRLHLLGFSIIGAGCLLLLFWLFGRRAKCTFKITCGSNDEVTRVHEMLERQFAHVTVLTTAWRYEVKSEQLGDWSELCIQRANVRAERVAKALGVVIVGVFSYEETHSLPARNYTSSSNAGLSSRHRVARSAESAGAYELHQTVEGSERTGANIRIQYRVAKLPETPPPISAASELK